MHFYHYKVHFLIPLLCLRHVRLVFSFKSLTLILCDRMYTLFSCHLLPQIVVSIGFNYRKVKIKTGGCCFFCDLLISSFFAYSPSFSFPPLSSSPLLSVLIPYLCFASSRAPLHGHHLIRGAVGALLGALGGERQPQRAPPRLDCGPAGPAGSRCSPLSGAGPADMRPVSGHFSPGGHPALH